VRERRTFKCCTFAHKAGHAEGAQDLRPISLFCRAGPE
jgi:hypothetical protein